MQRSVLLLSLALLCQGAAAFFQPSSEEWQQLEVVPVVMPVRPVGSRGRELPRYIRLPTGATILCDGEMSPACKKILEKNVAGIYDDEDWAYGDGYYASNWPDIDQDADVGVIGMPYSMDDDLLGAHISAISGTEPCGGCPGT